MTNRNSPTFDHTGSIFGSFLEEENILEKPNFTAIKRVTDWQLDNAARNDSGEGIRQGLEDAKNGKLRPVREFFAEFEAAHPELASCQPHPA